MGGNVGGPSDGDSSQTVETVRQRRGTPQLAGSAGGGGGRFGLLELDLEPWRLAPVLLQLVAVARLGGEDVEDDVEVVEDRPAGFAAAVDPAGQQLRLA